MSRAGSSSICLTNKSLVSDGDEMIQSVNDEVNIAKDGCISLLMTWLIGMLVDPVTVNNGPFQWWPTSKILFAETFCWH